MRNLIAAFPRVRLPGDPEAERFGGLPVGEDYDFQEAVEAYASIEAPSKDLRAAWRALELWARTASEVAQVGRGLCLALRQALGAEPAGDADEPTEPRATRPREFWEPDPEADHAAKMAEIEASLAIYRELLGRKKMDRLLAKADLERLYAYPPLTLGPDELDPEPTATVSPYEMKAWQEALDTGYERVVEGHARALGLAWRRPADVLAFPGPELVTAAPEPEPVTAAPEPEPVTAAPEPELVTAAPILRPRRGRRWIARGVATAIAAAAAVVLFGVFDSKPATATATPLPLSATDYVTCPEPEPSAVQPARPSPEPAAAPAPMPAASRMRSIPPRRKVSPTKLIDVDLIVRQRGQPDLRVSAQPAPAQPTGGKRTHVLDMDAVGAFSVEMALGDVGRVTFDVGGPQ